MKKINFIKISLDIVMTLLFVLLYNKRVVTGLSFHEIVGLGIGGIFIIHIALNHRWVKQVTLNMLKRNMAVKTRIGYIVDLLLLFSIGYIIISGIIISKILFPNINVGNERFFQSTHISVAYASLLLIGIHLGFHWTWVMNTFKKIFKVSTVNSIGGYVAKALMIVVLASGIFSMYTTNYFNKLPGLSSTGNGAYGGREHSGNNSKSSFEWEGMSAQGNKDSVSTTQGSAGRKGFAEHGNGGFGKNGGSVNIFNILQTYVGIIGVFAIVTFYIEKLLLRLRKSSRSAYTHA